MVKNFLRLPQEPKGEDLVWMSIIFGRTELLSGVFKSRKMPKHFLNNPKFLWTPNWPKSTLLKATNWPKFWVKTLIINVFYPPKGAAKAEPRWSNCFYLCFNCCPRNVLWCFKNTLQYPPFWSFEIALSLEGSCESRAHMGSNCFYLFV